MHCAMLNGAVFPFVGPKRYQGSSKGGPLAISATARGVNAYKILPGAAGNGETRP
jgi:hypothetical protein